jgi:peptidoglycan hydrolase CwlO-like protein
MIYDTTKHALCENWGTTIAVFEKNVLARTAFEILDKINEYPHLKNLECDLDTANQTIAELDAEIADLKKADETIRELKEKIESLENSLMFADDKNDRLEEAIERLNKEVDELDFLKGELSREC